MYARRRRGLLPWRSATRESPFAITHSQGVASAIFLSVSFQCHPALLAVLGNFADNLTWDFIHRKSGSELFPRTWVQLE